MVVFTLRLPPLLAAKLIAVLTAIVMRSRPTTRRGNGASADAWPSLTQQHADALEQLLTDGAGKIDTEVIVHVRGDGNTFDDGTPVADSIVERIAPAAFIRALIHDAESRPINASGRRRHPSTARSASSRNATGAARIAADTIFSYTTTIPPTRRRVTRS